MIITITGKPCSGKGTAAKEFCKRYNFEYLCTGDMFRALAKETGHSILSLQQDNEKIKEFDKIVDNRIIELGLSRPNDNIVIDSRLAWHFIPNSFKVFIDVDERIAGERLLSTDRETENIKDLESAIKSLRTRWQVENDRYTELYNINNLNPENYDFVINSNKLTPEQIVKAIHEAYLEHLKNL